MKHYLGIITLALVVSIVLGAPDCIAQSSSGADTSSAAASQPPPPPPELLAAIDKLKRGDWIRVRTYSAGNFEGEFISGGARGLRMLTAQAELAIPLSLISLIRKRSNYALWGGIAGAVLGGAGGVYWGNNGCESCTDSDKTVAIVGGVLGGAILGASAGNALPTWKELYYVRYPKPSDERIDSRPSTTTIRKPTAGRASLYLGYASPTERDLFDGAFGGRVNILSEIFDNILIGPEFGYYSLGSDTVYAADSTKRVLESVMQINLIGRVDGNVAFLPLYLLAGAGFHAANEGTEFWGYTIGLGTILADAPVAVGAEARWTSNITEADEGATIPDGVLSLTAGLEYKW